MNTVGKTDDLLDTLDVTSLTKPGSLKFRRKSKARPKRISIALTISFSWAS
ncbi:hypothetical protein GR198_03685 [Rhizobium leguminosarum]|nr:hypothetical protein [Rhizobium leguminosarum]